MTDMHPLLNSAAGDKWKTIGLKAHHGINTPLFSLRSKKSAGIGEFLDLKLLIDWLKPLGFDIIQLLPLYASGNDPSPYNALSANALNPVYLSLHALPGIEWHPDLLQEIEQLRKFSLTERVEYAQVKVYKEKILKSYFEKEQESICNHPAYLQFLRDHHWVKPYARFKALKKNHQDKHWNEWSKEVQPSLHEIAYHSAIQYLAYSQMQEVKAYAEKKEVYLMGDIPILISPDSSDVWSHPEIFNLDLAAGAPPDMYNKEGQYWGFPLYNYYALQKENFRFWRERLQSASTLFHLYRVDHIVGFFRIWAIPQGKKATEGFFVPGNQAEWTPQGEMMLKMMLESSPMLPIGEDLGVIPHETRAMMHNLGIPGTKVMRWERYWEGDQSFVPYQNYPQDSLTTVSTHDSEPLTLWWKMYSEEARSFAHFKGWNYTPELSFDQLYSILSDSHHTSSFFHINLLQEYLSLFPELTWGNALDERINFPGVVSSRNWTYRYKLSLEEMMTHEKLSETMKQLIQ